MLNPYEFERLIEEKEQKEKQERKNEKKKPLQSLSRD